LKVSFPGNRIHPTVSKPTYKETAAPDQTALEALHTRVHLRVLRRFQRAGVVGKS